jgi:glycosyltransferase involved in cell wall biosynthesis
MRICIARSKRNAYSETFIRDQIKGLSQVAEVFNVHSGRLPERKENGELLTPFPFWVLHKVIKTLTGRRNNFFIHYGFKKFLLENRIDVVLANYGLTGSHLAPICRNLQVPLVVIIHGFDATQHWVLKKYAEHYRKMFLYASAIIAVSNEMKKKLIAQGAPESKISVIPYGINIDQFSPSGEKARHPLFIAVGRFTSKKSPLTTIRAFHRVWLKHPEAKLVMIGGRTDLYKECVQLTRRLHLQNAIEFPGILTSQEIAGWLKRSHVFIQHSVTAANGDMEGTPVGILEACASALPVVSTLHGGIKDAVIHGQSGFLVPEHDEEGMAHYMSYLIERPLTAQEMGKAAREHMRTNYEKDCQITKLYNVLAAAGKEREERQISAVYSPSADL